MTLNKLMQTLRGTFQMHEKTPKNQNKSRCTQIIAAINFAHSTDTLVKMTVLSCYSNSYSIWYANINVPTGTSDTYKKKLKFNIFFIYCSIPEAEANYINHLLSICVSKQFWFYLQEFRLRTSNSEINLS